MIIQCLEKQTKKEKYEETHDKVNIEVICQQVRRKTYAQVPIPQPGVFSQSLVKIQIFLWTYGRVCVFESQASAKLQLIFASQANHYCVAFELRTKSSFFT